MKLGVFTVVLGEKPFDEALAQLEGLGVEMVEIGCAGYPGPAHCDPKVLLHDETKFKEFQDTIERHHMQVSAISCHGNPVHPNKQIAAEFDQGITDGILIAEKLGIHQINTFSGCPGDSEGSQYPNWVTCPWPDDFLTILDYQWNEVLIPYWKEKVKFAKAHGIEKIALEPHPGFCVYNTETVLRLREAVGPEIGANLDPSHLFWQGMDPVAVIKALGDSIFHFHAKDTFLDPQNLPVNGVLDTKKYERELERSWYFRSVGYGHDDIMWKNIISALRLVGYDHAISIEHEDGLMSTNEGLTKAIEFLKPLLIAEPRPKMWWA